MPKRLIAVPVVTVVLGLIAIYVLRPPRGVPDDAPTLQEMADSVGAPVMQHIYRGYVPGRSGEVSLVPKPQRFVIGEWDLTTLGTKTPTLSTSHPNPWAYLTRVPIILYGPGFAPRGVTVTRKTDIASLAPTYARLLGMKDYEADGRPLPEVLRAGGDRTPRVIATVALDGGGWNALQEHAGSWPNIRQLASEGTLYTNATIGSAPSITGALHATFGTGSYPRTAGIPGNQLRDGQGETVDAWLDAADPRYLRIQTLSDLWDRQNGNQAIAAEVAYEGWHLGMLGHGAYSPGGDRDISVLWSSEENRWWTNEDYYELPAYLQTTDLAKLESYEEKLDARDGLEDESWFGHTLEELQEDRVRPGTPAFARFTGDAVVDVLEREPFGRDRIADLLWVEFKMPDYAGHAWNMIRPEQGDVLAAVDEEVGRIKATLDRVVGRGRYLLAISADHGQQPLPDLFGGWRINNRELERDIEQRFGRIVEKITPVEIYFDLDAVGDKSLDLADVARYIGTYTIGDNIAKGLPGADLVPKARLDERLFAGAFPGEFIAGLTADDIASFGNSDYTEGEF